MKNRAVKFLLPLLAAVASACAFISMPSTGALAAGECLAGPKGAAPQGSHWYYRIDHANNRNCWYVRQVRAKAVPAEATASTESTAPQPAPPLQRDVANARAEFTADAGQPAAAELPSTAPAPADVTGSNSAPNADPQAGSASTWPMASRWSNNRDAGASADPDSSRGTTQPMPSVAQAAPPAANVAPVPPAPLKETTSNTISTLVGSLVAALVLAGLIVGAIVHFGKRRPAVRRDANGRPDIWGSLENAPDHADRNQEPPMNWVRIARERQVMINQAQEVEQLLERAPRRPAT